MTLQIPVLSRLAAPAIILLVTSLGMSGTPASPDPASLNPGFAHAFTIVSGEVQSLGRVPGEGGLVLVAATVRTADRNVTIALAPPSVFRQTGFLLREGDRVNVRLFRIPGEGPVSVQKIHNRTLDRSIRLRSIRGEPLWDGEGQWHGGFCTDFMEHEASARR